MSTPIGSPAPGEAEAELERLRGVLHTIHSQYIVNRGDMTDAQALRAIGLLAGAEDPFDDYLCATLASGPAAHRSRGEDREAVAKRILSDACEPWSFSTGGPPDYDSPLTGVFCAGMGYTEQLLAKFLGVERYEGGDGSEDFDSDATMTLQNILVSAGLYDPEDGRTATLAGSPPPSPAPVPDPVEGKR